MPDEIRCVCVQKVKLSTMIGRDGLVEVQDDVLHTEHGCYHASLFPTWNQLRAATEALDKLGLPEVAKLLSGGRWTEE